MILSFHYGGFRSVQCGENRLRTMPQAALFKIPKAILRLFRIHSLRNYI